MRLPHSCVLAVGQIALALGRKIAPDPALARENAPQVFNAVHSAMRQWGSSVYHNGMSFFLVNVPRGNLFYHGTDAPERINGFEWLAFEPEHAAQWGDSYDGHIIPAGTQPSLHDAPQSIIMTPPPPQRRQARRGYIHTYNAARDLRFLLTDGQSAAKGFPGPLDTQDLVLIMDTKLPEYGFEDYYRAEALCKLALAHNVDGIVRAETGFEIIYCAFEDGGGLNLVSIVGSPFSNETTGETQPAIMETIRAVAQRYHGFEADRAFVDYSSMVSAFWYPVNRTNPNVSRRDLPRLVNATNEERRTLLNRVLEVSAARTAKSESVNWQAVADRTVNFFERRIAALAAPEATPATMRRLVDSIINRFIDFALPSSPRRDAIFACAYQHLDRPLQSRSSWTPEDHLIFESFAAVTHRICTSLFVLRTALDMPEKYLSLGLVTERAIVSDLMSWLGWTWWRGCGGQPCDDHYKICLIPMFPIGTVEDHWHPRCKDEAEIEDSRGYFSSDQ